MRATDPSPADAERFFRRDSTYRAALDTERRLTPAAILGLVAGPLAEVEKEFRRNLDSPIGVIADIGRYIADSGGKRIRPALLLLAARACGYFGPRDISYAAVFEVIHSATLVHDDVIDGAETRRGRRSVNARWDNTLTVLLGDWLYIRSLAMALAGEDLRVLRLMSDVTLRMIEGEMIQTHTTGRLDVSEVQYLDIVTRKTAWLFSGCCRTGALLADREEWQAPLSAYGLSLGIAFQMVDDLLDFTSEEAVLGKPVAADLKEGKLTLPVIDLLSRRPALTDVVRRIVERPQDCESAYGALVAALHEENCILNARARAEAEAARARASLAVLPASEYRDALEALPDLLVTRRF